MGWIKAELSESMHQQLRILAVQKRKSVQGLVSEAITAYITEHEKEKEREEESNATNL